MSTILVVDDESGIRALLKRVLARQHEVLEAANGREALELIESHRPDVMICDLKMPELDGVGVLKELQTREVAPVSIVLTAHGTVETAVEAMKLGAFDYLRKPFDVEEVKVVVDKALSIRALKDEVRSLRKEFTQRSQLDRIIGKSEGMRKVYDLIEQVAPTRSTVLITGESGTGKELIARALHAYSQRAGKKFVAVNCAAISEELLESELFGHEKGSFTGATGCKPGKFEIASGGTIFLDEVSEMSPRLQAKFLRVLQESEIDRVGGTEPIPVDVRILASTNRVLKDAIRDGKFREDLYYRLKVVELTFPPLRERKEDIPLLVQHFLTRYAGENSKNIRGVEDSVWPVLMRYNWPGNVRELENVIERAVVLCRGEMLEPGSLPEEIHSPEYRSGLEIHVGMTVAEAERILILKTLEACDGNRSKSVEQLGISIRTLRNKLAEYREAGIEISECGNAS